jgi:two-component system chemotaxis sensor kinase CheA
MGDVNMNKNKYVRHILVILTCLLFVVFGIKYLTYYLLHNEYIEIDKKEIISDYGDIRYRLLKEDEPSNINYSFNISKDELSTIKGNKVLVINKLAVQTYYVYFNGMLVSHKGTYNYKKNMVHNSTEVFIIDNKLIKANNTIEIKTYSELSTGLYGTIHFTNNYMGDKIYRYETLKRHIIATILIANIILCILLLIITGNVVMKKDESLGYIYVYLSCSVFLISFFSTELIRNNLFLLTYGINYRIKITILHLVIVFLGIVVNKLITIKFKNIFSIIMFISIMLNNIFVESIIRYKNITSIINLSLLISLLIYMFYLIKYSKEIYKKISYNLIISICIIMFSMMTTYSYLYKYHHIFVYHINVIPNAVVLYFVVYSIYNEIKQISEERELEARELKIKQKNIYTNIGEAFFSVDTGLNVKERYTKICNEIFGENISGKNIGNILGSNVEEVNLINRSLNSTIEKKLASLVCKELLPNEYINNERHFRVRYHFVQEKDNIVEIIVIMADITELKSLESQLKYEKRKSNLIASSIIDRDNLIQLINDFIEFTTYLDANEIINSEDIINKVHTFKGNFGMYSLNNIVLLLQKFEDKLLKNKNISSNYSIKLRETMYKDLEMITELTGSSFFEDELFLKVNKENLELVYKEVKRYFYNKQASLIIEIINHMFYKSINEILLFYARKSILIAKEEDILIKPIVVSGDEIFIDINKYKEVCNSLVHIFNNCIEHGIESEEERMEVGKPLYGEISCTVSDYGNFFEIVIEDDGRGIDLNEIKNKALKKNLVKKEEIERMDEKELLELIFIPQFSTKDKARKLSGRGVGMSTVKKEVEKIGGTIRISSYLDFGTQIKLLLPKSTTNLINYFTAPILLDIFVETTKIYIKSNNILDLPFSVVGNMDKFETNDETVILPYNGPEEGLFVMSCNKQFLIQLVKNMMEKDHITDEEYNNVAQEVLKEVCNIIAGHTISLFDLQGSMVDILTPEIIDKNDRLFDNNIFSWSISYEGYEICLGIIKTEF